MSEGTSSAALNQVRNHLAFGQTHAASQIVDALVDQDASNLEFRAVKGLVAFRKGDFSEARRIWQGIVNEQPNSNTAKECILCLAVLSADLGKYQESESLFQLYKGTSTKYQIGYGDHSLALSLLSIAKKYHKVGKLSEAVKALEQAIKVKPDFTEANCYLAKLYLKVNQPSRAIGHLSQALEHEAENFDVWLLLGKARLQEGRYREARSSITRAKSIRPADSLPDILLETISNLDKSSPTFIS